MKKKTSPKHYKLTFAEALRLLFDEKSSIAFRHSRIRPRIDQFRTQKC